MAKIILMHDEAREALKRGIDIAVNAVKVTLGPRGRNVVMQKSFGGPMITNDGVSIAKEIELVDPIENMGAQLIKEVAVKTNELAGDGTTTSTVLLGAIIDEGMKYLASGVSVIGIKNGITSGAAEIMRALETNSQKIATLEEITHVATVSAESVELGTLIAETVNKVGVDGVVTVEESKGLDMTSEVVAGMSFDRGYSSPYMVTDNERMEAVYHDAVILITDQSIMTLDPILPILESLAKSGRKDLVIIADEIGGSALTTLVLNKLRGILNVLCIKAPSFGDRKKEILEDIATLTGANVISNERGMKLEEVTYADLGHAGKLIAKKDTTIIIEGKGNKDNIDARVMLLRNQIENVKNTYEKDNIIERIAKMTGGIAVIRVGAMTETEMKYLKLKVEDAVNATKAALSEGVVSGGGSALLVAANSVLKNHVKLESNDEEIGFNIIMTACKSPIAVIAHNAGQNASDVIAKVGSMDVRGGYDALKNMYHDDMFIAGIIDPLRVTKSAILNAASIAGTFLTTEVAIADIPGEIKKEEAGY